MRNHLILLLAIVSLTISCKSDDNRRLSHIYFSLNGATINGEFRIQDDMDPANVVATAVIYPAVEDQPEVAILSYSGGDEQIGVALHTPAEEQLLLLIDEYPFTMSITFQQTGVILISKEVSIHITKFKRGSGGLLGNTLEEMVANFEGTMTYTNPQQVIEIHTIKGDLVFSGY